MDLSYLALAGRVLLGLGFVYSGVRLLVARTPVAGLLASKGVPIPMAAVLCGGAFEIVAGAMAVIGLWMPAVAIAMAVFVAAATVMVHDFWNGEGAARVNDENGAIANILLIAALLVTAAYPW